MDRNNEYIIPPGLKETFYELLSMLEIDDEEPILIIGHTGVGKSCFLKAVTDHYDNNNSKRKIVKTVNCSHFSGDLNMVRSELFGHLKGSFTGAISNKKGIIEDCSGGVLILEEIGDLPQEVQAQLLTFIEDGIYYQVGSAKPQRTNVKIVSATNRPECLRDDFRFRFSELEIPPLCRRRLDTLFYFEQIDSDMFQRLRSWEIFALLAYSWPGNVREIERLIAKIRYKETREKQFKHSNAEVYGLDPYKFMSSMFGGLILKAFEFTIAKELYIFICHFPLLDYGHSKGEFEAFRQLDKIFAKYFISINAFNHDIPFRGRSLIDNVDVNMVSGFKMCNSSCIHTIYEGFDMFCKLFGKNQTSETSLLSIEYDVSNCDNFKVPDPLCKIRMLKVKGTASSSEESPRRSSRSFIADKKYRNIIKFAFKWATGVEARFFITSNGLDLDFKNWFIEQKTNKINYQLKNNSEAENNILCHEMITSMTKDDLLSLYYSKVLKKHRYKQVSAAKNAGLKLSTFRSQAIRYGVSLKP